MFRTIAPIVALASVTLPAALPAFPAGAAGFSCADARTGTERAICGDPGLSALDEALNAAYRALWSRLGGADAAPNAAQQALRGDQRVWLGRRNGCGADAACLADAYRRRLDALTLVPAVDATDATRPFTGVFDHGGFMTLLGVALSDGRVAVTVSGAEPSRGRWICEFAGVGRPAAGRLVVGGAGRDGDVLIIDAAPDGALAVPDTVENRATADRWCGFGGSFVHRYVPAAP